MPYIPFERREDLEGGSIPVSPGELNFIITDAITNYLRWRRGGDYNYEVLNEVMGVLESAKLELYRRIVAEYEDTKREENGDVYGLY